jgi:hypothetical protein
VTKAIKKKKKEIPNWCVKCFYDISNVIGDSIYGQQHSIEAGCTTFLVGSTAQKYAIFRTFRTSLTSPFWRRTDYTTVYKDMHRQPPVLLGANKLDNGLPWRLRQNLAKFCNTTASSPKKRTKAYIEVVLVNRTTFPLNRPESNIWLWWRNYDRPKRRWLFKNGHGRNITKYSLLPL